MIDISFDFRSDTPAGKDPDAFSPTLRRYHALLWSKSLPDGTPFTLRPGAAGGYLVYASTDGNWVLTSDAVIPSFRKERSLARIHEMVPRTATEELSYLAYTIGGMMLFPGRQIGRRMTINGARGCHPRIKDRFDLTLEYIRRHYCNEDSPLSEVLARYHAFFAIFRTLREYVQFFLLHDLVSEDFTSVRFSLPFRGFDVSPLPGTLDEYERYSAHAKAFLRARNARILDTTVSLGPLRPQDTSPPEAR